MKIKSMTLPALMLLLSFGYANAQDFDPAASIENIKKCEVIQSDSQRLACFDSAILTLNQAIDDGDIMIVDKVSVDEAKKEGFGLNLPSLSGLGKIFKSDGEPDLPSDVKSISIEVVEIEEFGYKKNRFILENGQVWSQVESISYRPPRRKKDEPYIAVISKGAFGSFNLRINEEGKRLKVRRVK